MKTLAKLVVAVLFAVALPNAVWARGGGGCLEEGTLISTPHGAVAIETLRPGDTVWSVSGGQLHAATVQAVFQVQPDEYVELTFGNRVLRVTPEHPVAIAPGVFRIAGDLATRRVCATRPAYNLLVSPGGTFFANGVLLHNKGCFLPDTPILRADGISIPIHDVRAGDELLAFTSDGAVVTANVLNIIGREVDEYAVVTTDRVVLRVTPEHPFYVGDGTFKTLEALQVGDAVFAFDGQGLSAQRIVSIERIHARTQVFNLQTDAPHTFFANGVAVHNKGGGGGGGGFGGGGFHGGGGGNGDVAPVIMWIIIVVIVVVTKARKSRDDEDLDYTYSEHDVAGKAEKTQKLLKFIARVDGDVAPQKLMEVAQTTFVKLQQCWQARDYAPMQPLLMPDLYAEHCAQIRGMVRDHEINIIAQLAVESVAIVNIRYPHKENDREFTALITASARDYYVDDRTQEFQRGDEEPARFQEFWTFQRQDGKWLLREIEQTRESDKLKEDNFFEPFTDKGVEQVYGEAAKAPDAPAGPWLEKAVETKATRTDRLLNFLVQTDKLWDRQAMLERARQVFTEVLLAREAGDVTQVPDADLFPAVALDLREEISKRRQEGVSIQFRNFCVRKVELILVRNFTDNTLDEFVVRISAHAQRIVTKNGAAISQDEYVTPFEEYWTFGRLDNRWALKEVLPPSQGAELVDTENLDQDSSPDQLQWYYRQTRAK